MSSQAGQSVSPPPVPASSASSGVRRHHTISAASRGSRPTSKIQVSEQEEAEQEEVWSQDEIVDQDWRGGIGAVGEKSSLHRQASLPTKYHRAFGQRQAGTHTPRTLNSLTAIAGHEGDEEEWEQEMRGLRGEEEAGLQSSDHGHGVDSAAASPLSPHYAGGIPNVPSPPPAMGNAGVRRHQSLNYPNATNVRRLGGLKRAGTLQAGPLKGHPQHGIYSGAQSPSPTGADEDDDDDSTRADEEPGYFRLPAQQGQGQYPTSPIGRSSPWSTPGNDWRTQIGGNGGSNMGAGAGGVDDVSRALSALEIQQQYNAGNYQQTLRNGGIAAGGSRKLQLVTDFDHQVGQGIQSASAYVPPIGHGLQQQNQSQRQNEREEQQGSHPHRDRALTTSGNPWDQKERLLGDKVSNANLQNLYQAPQGKNGNAGVSNVPNIPPQYLGNQGQAPRLGPQGGNNGQQSQGGRGSAQGSNQSPPADSFLTSPIDVPTLIATKGYNPVDFDTRPLFARYFVIKSYTEDDVHKSLKYEIWSSTDPGNKRLDKAFKENAGRGPIYLFFSVNASGHFCGMAEMLTPVDYTRSSTVWASDKWKGVFKVRWIFVRDIPNASLRHIRLNNTQERKPVTNSRDTQELLPEAGQEMLRIFHTHPARTSLLQDFAFYELQAMQKVQAAQSMHSGTSSPDQNGQMSSSGMQSPVLSPSASPGQHPFAMSNPTALAYAAQHMGLAQMNIPVGMGMNGMNMNPMLQMQMNLASMSNLGNLGSPFANPHAMQSVMRNPSPGPMPVVGGQNFMGMGGHSTPAAPNSTKLEDSDARSTHTQNSKPKRGRGDARSQHHAHLAFRLPSAGQQSWKTTENIADLLFSTGHTKSGLDLVFGIKPNGAAYLLIPRSDAAVYPRLFPGRTYDGANFISSSPVHFVDAAALKARLDQLAQPAKRKKARNNDRDVPRDRSAANRGFTTGTRENVVSMDGINRAAFEQQRLLVRHARGELDRNALYLYNIAPPSWVSQIRVVSFAYNLWASDHRGKLARGDDLKVLDVSWTEFTLGNTLSARADSTVHFKLQENARFRNKNPAESSSEPRKLQAGSRSKRACSKPSLRTRAALKHRFYCYSTTRTEPSRSYGSSAWTLSRHGTKESRRC
ncbi:hypothetical protein NM688_g5325 [Phlebia brevispora]|uniref:Uncharacterized protein n=1 Tax=Phlebia brevispora TaxID=194682 RepID=A0ACC1SX09_9APHY|nr:hypothetical protein NM688_g5325 [Phlebia brevispora]